MTVTVTDVQDKHEAVQPALNGIEAWGVVVGAWIANFATLGYFYSFGVFVVPFQHKFDAGRGAVSLIYSVMFLVWHGISPFIGPFADYHGVKTCLMLGALLWGGALTVSAFSESLWVSVLIQGVLLGIGGALTAFPVLAVVMQWFDTNRGFANGVAVTGSGCGNFVYPWLIQSWLDDVGVRDTLLRLAGLQVLLYGAALLLVKRRLPTSSETSALDYDAMKDWNVQLLVLAAVFFSAGAFVVMVHMSAFLIDHGHSEDAAAGVVAWLGGGSAVGRLVQGAVADYAGILPTFRGSMLGASVVLALWPFCTEIWSASLFAFAYSFLTFGWYTLLPLTTSLYRGSARLSSAIGLIFFGFVPGAVSPALAGWLRDSSGNYGVAQAYATVCMLSCSGVLFVLQPPPGEPVDTPTEVDMSGPSAPVEVEVSSTTAGLGRPEGSLGLCSRTCAGGPCVECAPAGGPRTGTLSRDLLP